MSSGELQVPNLLSSFPNSDTVYDNAAVGHQLGVDRNDMLAPAISRVLVIYTGGTIGMKHTPEHGYIPLPNYLAESLSKVQRFHDPNNELDYPSLSRSSSHDSLDSLSSIKLNHAFGSVTNTVKTIQRDGPNKGRILTSKLPSLITPISLFGKRIRYSILEYTPLLDSCDITMSDWVRVAGDIKENYQMYDAFIVLHGTDTMAYTASALSFMLEELGKTVIITGSQVPLTEVRNDAVENLLGALTIAGHFVLPEVSLYFGKKLYRGNRTSKISAVDFEAFDSPNMPPLVEVGINIDVKWPLVLRPTQIAKFNVCQKLNPNVGALRLFPGINDSTVRSFLAPPLQGVVLETFGAGNAPARPSLLEALKEACDRGVVIVNCTQCRKGVVTDAYATGKQLSAIGVVPGADMTPECALTKLAYLLGKHEDPQEVRHQMTRNLRGELTVRSPYQRFSASHLSNLISEGLAERTLLPVLLCLAAQSNDLEGLKGLVKEGAIVNCADYDGRVPLHVACREGHLRVVEYLLLHGASLHVRDRSGHTPLFEAVVEKRAEVVAMLREAGAHLAESELNDMGPYWSRAIKNNHVRWIQIALEAGFNVNWSDPAEGRAGVDLAVLFGRLNIFKMLIQHPLFHMAPEDKLGLTTLDRIDRLIDRLESPSPPKNLTLAVLNEMKSLLKSKIKA